MATFDASNRRSRVSWSPSTYTSAFSELLNQNWVTISGVEKNRQGQDYRYAFDDDASHYLSITLVSGSPSRNGYTAKSLNYFIGIEHPDGTESTHSEYYEGDIRLSSDLLGNEGTITRINTVDEHKGVDYGSSSASGSWDASRLSSATTGQEAHQILFEGHDTITGSSFDDDIDSYLGDDIVYGSSGNDRLADGLGWNILYGEAGEDTFVVRPGSGPSWFDKRKLPSNGFPLASKKRKVKGKKRKFILVDTDYDRFADFNINEDSVAYEGIAPDSVVYETVAGSPGIFFLTADGGNVLAYLPTISEEQYLETGIYEL